MKVDPKTEDLLNEYRKKKRKDGGDENLGANEAEIDDETKKDDDVVRTALQNILQEAIDTYQLGHGNTAFLIVLTPCRITKQKRISRRSEAFGKLDSPIYGAFFGR